MYVCDDCGGINGRHKRRCGQHPMNRVLTARELLTRQRQVICTHVFPGGRECGAVNGESCRDEKGRYMSGVHAIRAERARRTGMDKVDLDRSRLRRRASDEIERRQAKGERK